MALKQWLIGAGLILSLLTAGCSGERPAAEDRTVVVDMPAEEAVLFPLNGGWTPAMSISPGIPIELQGSADTEYELSGDTHYLGVNAGGRPESLTETDRKAGDVLYWSPLYEETSTPVPLEDIEASWITAVRKENGLPTGLVVIKVAPVQDGEIRPLFQAEVTASLSFPIQDGAYPSLTDDELQKMANGYRE